MSGGLVISGARVLTMEGGLGVLERADVVVENGVIARVEAGGGGVSRRAGTGARVVEARGRVLMPAFIDAHTHALWVGDRLDEWEMKRRGASYLEILRSGGGIMSTVRTVRRATGGQLEDALRARLGRMAREGTGTVEVKSGYGLTTEDELKMLRAIASVGASGDSSLPSVVPTALLGHALDPDVPAERFIDGVVEETLPAVHREFPGITVDAYCEGGAWPLEACVRLFQRAMELGHPVRVHADQFSALGMCEWAAANGVVSVDHLEASTGAGIAALGGAGVFAGVLPCCGLHLDRRYADGRALIDAGARVFIATNFNPGSAPCGSVPLAVALGVRFCGLRIDEALIGCTRNGAGVLGLGDRGVIAPGKRADLVLLSHTDERLLGYEFGGRAVDEVVLGGVVL